MDEAFGHMPINMPNSYPGLEVEIVQNGKEWGLMEPILQVNTVSTHDVIQD